MGIIKITKENFEQEVLNSENAFLLDFFAPWCGPCKIISQVLEEVASEIDDIKIGKVNIDEFPEVAVKYGVMNIPTLIFFKNGEVEQKMVGAKPKGAVLAMIGK